MKFGDFTYKSLLGTIFKNRRLRVESAYAEQIEKELRKSVLLFSQFFLPEALRRSSRNLGGIMCPKSCACLMSFQDLSYSFLK